MTHRRAPPPPAIGPSMRRRRVAGLVAATAVLAAPRVASAAAATTGDPSPPWRTTFTAFCDTIVPADATTPSASALGIDRELLAEIAADADAARLVDSGCRWLDAAVRGAFAAADEPARVAAVTRMAAQPASSAPARCYLALRNSLFEAYYGRPESWRGLALDRPPQPLGFHDAVR